MDPQRGPVGDAREVFQTNFAFGRAVRLQAQNVHPGYWQSAHPDEDGYRPDQIMRYSEGNLNRLQIAGELHVKSGKVLEAEKVPELDAPLELALLTTEASWENRAQMSRTSARDFVEALLLDVHHAQYLQAASARGHHRFAAAGPDSRRRGRDPEALRRHGDARRACTAKRGQLNLEASRGRMNTDWIEPETLFWAAWRVLPPGEKARDRARGDRRLPGARGAGRDDGPAAGRPDDPMEWHRHRIHPLLWQALEAPRRRPERPDRTTAQRSGWHARRHYLARRPVWSQLKNHCAPWQHVRTSRSPDARGSSRVR